MHRRCCWPPESEMPGRASSVLDFVPQRGLAQRAARRSLRGWRGRGRPRGAGRRRRSRRSTSSGTGSASGRPCRRRAARAPDRRSGRRCPAPFELDLPSARAPRTTSCMRFRQRMKVLLPQPDGPMIAVTRARLDVDRDVLDGFAADVVPGVHVARAHPRAIAKLELRLGLVLWCGSRLGRGLLRWRLDGSSPVRTSVLSGATSLRRSMCYVSTNRPEANAA